MADTTTTTSLDEIITDDNVQRIGELMAVCALKTIMRYSGGALNNLYKALLKDIYRPSSERRYSDAYDIVQEAICFLCGHMGKKLGFVLGKNKFGNIVTVKKACYRHLDKYLCDERNRIYCDVDIDDLYSYDEPVVPFEPDTELSDWSKADAIIEKMDLNKGQLETLNCYMSGMGFVKTARLLDVNNATVWRRMKQIRDKYVTLIGAYC